MTDIGIVNLSTVIPSSMIAAAIAPGQRHLDGNFAPFWNVSGTLHFLGNTMPAIKPGLLVIYQDDTPADGQGDLAYHIDPNGQPTALIFAKEVLATGQDPIIAGWHEILEALADPLCNRMAPNGIDIVEACDAVEMTFVKVDGVLMPDFVTPQFFGLPAIGAPNRYDFNAELKGPAPDVLPEGYLERAINGQWSIIRGERCPQDYWRLSHHGRRAWRKAATSLPIAA